VTSHNVIAVLITFALVFALGTGALYVVTRWDVGTSRAPGLPMHDGGVADGGTDGGGHDWPDVRSSVVPGAWSAECEEAAAGVTDVIFVATIVAFFVVAAMMVWACNRITADAAVETEWEATSPRSESGPT